MMAIEAQSANACLELILLRHWLELNVAGAQQLAQMEEVRCLLNI